MYRSFLPAPQAGELSSCTAASGGKQAGKAKLPSPPAFLLFFYSAGIRFSRDDIMSAFSYFRGHYPSGAFFEGVAAMQHEGGVLHGDHVYLVEPCADGGLAELLL